MRVLKILLVASAPRVSLPLPPREICKKLFTSSQRHTSNLPLLAFVMGAVFFSTFFQGEFDTLGGRRVHFGPAPRGFTECRGVVLRHDEDRLVRQTDERADEAEESKHPGDRPLPRAPPRAACCCSPGVCAHESRKKAEGMLRLLSCRSTLLLFHPGFVSRAAAAASRAASGLFSSNLWCRLFCG